MFTNWTYLTSTGEAKKKEDKTLLLGTQTKFLLRARWKYLASTIRTLMIEGYTPDYTKAHR